jgi:hypothetical protein
LWRDLVTGGGVGGGIFLVEGFDREENGGRVGRSVGGRIWWRDLLVGFGEGIYLVAGFGGGIW